MASGRERHGGIQKGLCLRDHFGAARLVVAFAVFAGLVRYGVGAIEGVVKAAPACVGRIQRVARVGERHHQLRPADLADFLIDVGSLDLLGARAPAADSRSASETRCRRRCRTACPCWPGASRRFSPAGCRAPRAVRGSWAARSRTMAASPAQKASGEIPVSGLASLAMKSNRTGAIFNPWASIQFIIKLSREAASAGCFGGKNKQRRRGGVFRPFSAKAWALRRPFAGPDCANNGRWPG